MNEMKYTIIDLIIFVVWPAIILLSLYIAVKRKNKEAIVPFSIATFFIILSAWSSAYQEIANTNLREGWNFLLALVTFITCILGTIFGMVAFVKKE